MERSFLEKLRDLAGNLSACFRKTGVYQRFNIGDQVRFFNDHGGYWDTGEVKSIMNRDTYTIVNPDYDTFMVHWSSLRPMDDGPARPYLPYVE
jgi:hypothetical protein